MQVLGLPSRIHKGNCGGGTALGLLTSSSLLLYNNIYIFFFFFFGGRVGMQKNSRETKRSQKQEKGHRSIANQGLLPLLRSVLAWMT